MGDLVDQLISAFEFLIQGVLVCITIGYAIAWFHPLKRALYGHIRETARFLTEFHEKRQDQEDNAVRTEKHAAFQALLSRPFLGIGALGIVYYIGILTNTVGYWFMQPFHEEVIESAYGNNALRDSNSVGQLRIWLRSTVVERPHGPPKDAYKDYVRDEAVWRNADREAMESAVGSLFKQDRILRGTVMGSMVFFGFACLRFLWFSCLLQAARVGLFRRHRHLVYLYCATASPRLGSRLMKMSRDSRLKQFDSKIRVYRRDIRRRLASHTVFALCALAAVWVSVQAYSTTEYEFHLLVQEGASHPKQATSTMVTGQKGANADPTGK